MKLFKYVMSKDDNKLDFGSPLLMRGAIVVRIDRLAVITRG